MTAYTHAKAALERAGATPEVVKVALALADAAWKAGEDYGRAAEAGMAVQTLVKPGQSPYTPPEEVLSHAG